MTATATPPPSTPARIPTRTGRSLVDEALFDRLATFLERENHVPRDRAERVLDQALAFLWTLGQGTDAPRTPSQDVDPGWHAFLLHTEEYDTWCLERFGFKLHHRPATGTRSRDGFTVRRTALAIADGGFDVDWTLWRKPAACNEPACCGDGGGCGGS
ncbi:glycine-rich domain-containing protein [Streptomyces formicae]